MLVLAFLALLAARPVGAQASLPDDSLRMLLAKATDQRWTVRATLIDGSAHTGGVDLRGEEVATVGRTRIDLVDLAALERRLREGGGGRKGFLLGTAVGAALVYQIACCAFEGGQGGVDVLVGSLAVGLLLGGVPGAIIGEMANPSATSWEKLWERTPEP